MVMSTAFRRYEWLDDTFNPRQLVLEKRGQKYVILFGLSEKDELAKIDTKKDYEKLIGWRE